MKCARNELFNRRKKFILSLTRGGNLDIMKKGKGHEHSKTEAGRGQAGCGNQQTYMKLSLHGTV